MRIEFEKIAAAGRIRRDQIEPLLQLTQARYVRHRSWGVGLIRTVDTVFRRLKIDFPEKRGHYIDLAFASQILKPATRDEWEAKPAIAVRTMPWKLLPPGECDATTLKRYLASVALRTTQSPTVDVARLEFLLGLGPTQIFAGVDEFDGYLAFRFSSFHGAVLENPIQGNAIYVFDDNWRDLSKLFKTELFRQHEARFTRIVHSGDWQNRLRSIVTR